MEQAKKAPEQGGMQEQAKGKLIVFSAPSGAGKTTIVRHLLAQFPQLEFSISATTRPPREGEQDGKDYFFISREDFLHRVAQHEFIEFEEVYSGTLYGTLRSELDRIWSLGKHVIFDIDVEGGLRLKRKFPAQTLAVFVQPPSLERLRERLAGRGTDHPEKLRERIEKASKELAYAPKFDVVLLNDQLDKACSEAVKFVGDFIKA